MSKCFGLVFFEGDSDLRTITPANSDPVFVVCRNGHRIGYSLEGTKQINSSSNISIAMPQGPTIPWSPAAWRNNFESIYAMLGTLPPSGPTSSAETHDGQLFCTICNISCRTKNSFRSHLFSKRHQQEEAHLMET